MIPLAPIVFGIDVVLVATTAWMCLCARRSVREEGLVDTYLGWMLVALAWVVFSGVILGLVEALGRGGFFLAHLVGFLAVLGWRRQGKADAKQWTGWLREWWQLGHSDFCVAAIVAASAGVILILGVLAAQAEPTVLDALTYRLPRIGQWLQEGRITSLPTDDPRLNYMPIGPDVVIAWLLGATTEGFYLAPLGQLLGGTLLMGATFGVARLANLSRLAALGAVAVVVGMGNVAVQFTTLQSDLLVAGIVSASYLLWHRAIIRGEGCWVGGVGFGLAWGSKGTLFYLAPGAACWVGWLLWQRRPGWRVLAPTIAGAIVAFGLFAGPSYLRNYRDFHSIFGPHDAVLLHHGGPLTAIEHGAKLGQNLATSAVQLLDPTAQPFWCQEPSRRFGNALLPLLPNVDDRYLFLHTLTRRALVGLILQQPEPDADVISFGALPVLVFCLGGLVAAVRWRRNDATAAQVFVWFSGVVLFVLVQHALVQWHQWAFRFLILAAPWIAVVGVWFVARLSRYLQLAAWVVVVTSALQVFLVIQIRTSQAAWSAVTRPGAALAGFLYSNLQTWAGQLDGLDRPMVLACPINYPLGAFYRLASGRTVAMRHFTELERGTAEDGVNPEGGWLIVPANQFKGNEGRVMGRTWLFNGQENTPYSLAAYRALRPGEIPAPILYRAEHSFLSDGIERRLLVKSWQSAVDVRLHNPAAVSWHFSIRTGGGEWAGALAAGREIELTVSVPTGMPAEMVIGFHTDGSNEARLLYPTATVLPR